MWLAVLIPILVIAAGGIFVATKIVSSPGLASVGDCFAISEFSDQTEPEQVDCTDPSANVKLAVKLDSATGACPEGDYDELSTTGAGDNKLCLTLNVAKGDCVANVFSDTAGYKKVTCADPSAEIEILDVVEGATNVQSVCTDADSGLFYSQPPTSMCIRILQG